MVMTTFSPLLGRKKFASEEEEDEKQKVKKAKSRHAEEEEEEEEKKEEEDENDGKEDEDEKKTKKGEKASSCGRKQTGAHSKEEKDEENQDVKKGRHAERQRCAAIFGCKPAAGRPDMAAHLAFNTALSADEAISTLAALMATSVAVPADEPKRLSLDERMHAEQIRIGLDNPQPCSGGMALADEMTRLYNVARGEK